MKIRSLLVLGLLALGGLYSYAQDKVPGIIVELANGQKVEYRLADNPKFVFDGQTIKLTAESVAVEYTPSELAKVTTGEVENATGIEELRSQQGDIKDEAGFVRLNGFGAGEAVRVYSVGGNLVATHYVESDGSLVIPIFSAFIAISAIKADTHSASVYVSTPFLFKIFSPTILANA